MTYRHLFDLSGKVAIVTGGAGTIGQTLARGLAEFGCDVAIADINPAAAEPLVAEIGRLGRRAILVTVDVTRPESVDRMVEQVVREFGKVDVLLNHAGLAIRKFAVDLAEEDWDKVLDVNLKGIFLVARAVGRQMIAQGSGGKIVNTASVSAVRGHPRMAAYAASKGGVAQLTKVLANEWAPHGIQVNAIGPGYMVTNQTQGLLGDDSAKESTIRKIPAGRLGSPDDLVGAAVYLSSAASAYVTGHVLYVEGGRLID